MPRKLKPTQTKLSKQISTVKVKNKIGIMDYKNKKKHFPRAFRFTPEDLHNLKRITKLANQESKRYVSETKVLQALIQIGLEVPPSRVIKAIREIW
jgi:hypothetical protein